MGADQALYSILLAVAAAIRDCVAKRGVPALGRQIAVALYAVAMVVVIVGVDFAFFINRFSGTVGSECWNCVGVRSFLLQIAGVPKFKLIHCRHHA